jgi:hypothetical protein
MIKPRTMNWAVHAARKREKINAYRLLVGNPEEATRKTKKQV